jgi:hypothetical protein
MFLPLGIRDPLRPSYIKAAKSIIPIPTEPETQQIVALRTSGVARDSALDIAKKPMQAASPAESASI